MNLNGKTATFVMRLTLSSVSDQSTPLSLVGDDLQYQLKYDPTNAPPILGWYLYGNTWNPLEVFKTLEENTEYLIACYYDGETIGLSVDGEPWTASTAPTELYEDANMVFRAVYNDANAGPVTCSDFRVYPYVLTNEELAAL